MKREIKVIPGTAALTDDQMLTLDDMRVVVAAAQQRGATHIFIGNGNLFAARVQSDKDYIHALVARVEKLEQLLHERLVAEGTLP